jgi:hypothetical protein
MIHFSRKIVDKNVKQKRSEVWSSEVHPAIQRRKKKTYLKYERRKIYLISSSATN